MFKELMIMPHVVFGVLGVLAALWVAVEALNSSPANENRLNAASVFTAVFMWLSYLLGGWWYVVHYGAPGSDRLLILGGPWKWAHSFFMEAKEHLFFMVLFLSILLPIVTFRNRLFRSARTRQLTIVIALTIVVLGLGMEGFGALISKGVKMGLAGGK